MAQYRIKGIATIDDTGMHGFLTTALRVEQSDMSKFFHNYILRYSMRAVFERDLCNY